MMMMVVIIMNYDDEPGPSQRPGPNLLRVLQPCQGGLPQDHEEEVPRQGIITGSVHLYCTSSGIRCGGHILLQEWRG